jgi:hypothetical protein
MTLTCQAHTALDSRAFGIVQITFAVAAWEALQVKALPDTGNIIVGALLAACVGG